MMKRREFTQALIAIGLAPLMPAQAREAEVRFLNAHPGTMLDAKSLRYDNYIVDGRRIVIDLERVADVQWSDVTLFEPDFYDGPVQILETHVNITLRGEGQIPDDFYNWLMAEIRGNNNARIIDRRIGMDATATVDEVRILIPHKDNRELYGDETEMVLATTINYPNKGPRHAKP